LKDLILIPSRLPLQKSIESGGVIPEVLGGPRDVDGGEGQEARFLIQVRG
jgi:hypothetical protein